MNFRGLLILWSVVVITYAQNRCRAGRYFDPNTSGMRGVINLPTYGFYVDNAVATERFEPKDYVVLGGTWQGRAHAEFSPKPPFQYIKWSGEIGGVVAKIAVVNDDIYLGVNYNISTETGQKARFSISKIILTDYTISLYNRTGVMPSSTVLNTTAGSAHILDLKVCNGALVVVGEYTEPPVIDGLSPPTLPGHTGFLYSTSISPQVIQENFFTTWNTSFPQFTICGTFAQQITVLGNIDVHGLFISSINAVTGDIKYEDRYYGVTISAVTESNDFVYVFGQVYTDIWGIKRNQSDPTYMIQLNKDLLPSQAVPDMAVTLPFSINSAAVDPLGNVLALGLPNTTNVPTALIIDMDSSGVNISGQYNFTGLVDASYCPSLIMTNGRVFAVCNFKPQDDPRMVKFNPCTDCEEGTYSTDLDPVCLPCPIGTFSEQTGLKSAKQCTRCPAGTFNTEQGRNSSLACINCQSGTYSTVVGAATPDVCTNCPKGTYSPNSGAQSRAACMKCALGKTSVDGSPYCEQCPRRATSYDGVSCIACDYGFYLANSTMTCQPCLTTSFCPVGSITDNLSLPYGFKFANMVPEPNYYDVTHKPLDGAPLSARYDIWAKVGIFVAGIVAIIILIITISVLAYQKQEIRDRMQITDLFFPLRHKVEKGSSPVFRPTATGGSMSIIALILILVVIANVLFGYIDDNVVFTTQLEMKPWLDVAGHYSATLRFYTFDPNPNNCNGSVETMGFSGMMQVQSHLENDTACVVSWNCTTNCTTFGYKSGLTFSIHGKGISAIAIDYNVTSPYLWDETFRLQNGRIFPDTVNQVFRGEQSAKIVTRGFYTLHDYLEPNYWLPSVFLRKKTTDGLALSSLSHVSGATVTSKTYTSEADMISANIDMSFDASIIAISAKQRVDFFIFLGSAASVAGTILAVLGASFPLVMMCVTKTDKKIQQRRTASETDLDADENRPLTNHYQ